jgi:hypothetical protein
MSHLKDKQTLKELYSQKSKAEAKVKVLDREYKQLGEDCKVAHTRLKNLRGEILARKEQGITVTEHAVLRYLELTYKLDLDSVRKFILNTKLQYQIKTAGDGKYPISSKLKAVVKGNTIVTITS